MAPKLKEIERLKRGPKPKNVKEKVDLLREKSDLYFFGKFLIFSKFPGKKSYF